MTNTQFFLLALLWTTIMFCSRAYREWTGQTDSYALLGSCAFSAASALFCLLLWVMWSIPELVRG